ncbi:MAG: toprim domain-containing protein [Candidatus Bathyarchaeia archaeon]
MSTHLKERMERIQQVLACLIEESSKGILIIVEGRNDVKTLRQLGVEGEIISAKTGGRTQLDVICEVEESAAKEVIMLLDFDRHGREWTRVLKQRLEKARIKPNLTFWNELMRFAGREVKDVEGLASYVQTLKKKAGEIR